MIDLHTEFISAATWHGSLQVAAEMLALHPELASSDIHTAAILGDEACYHSPEDYNDGGLRALVESGRVNADNLTMMLVRKHDGMTTTD